MTSELCGVTERLRTFPYSLYFRRERVNVNSNDWHIMVALLLREGTQTPKDKDYFLLASAMTCRSSRVQSLIMQIPMASRGSLWYCVTSAMFGAYQSNKIMWRNMRCYSWSGQNLSSGNIIYRNVFTSKLANVLVLHFILTRVKEAYA